MKYYKDNEHPLWVRHDEINDRWQWTTLDSKNRKKWRTAYSEDVRCIKRFIDEGALRERTKEELFTAML